MDIITLFHATGYFNNKARWLEGVKSIEEVDHHLPRVGMKCRCVMENEEEVTAEPIQHQFIRVQWLVDQGVSRCDTGHDVP